MIQKNESNNIFYTPSICPDCVGTGTIVDYVAGCCRNPDEDGNCCNCPIPEPIQAQCARCSATGYLQPNINTIQETKNES